MKDAYGTSVSTLRELFTRLSVEGLLVAEGSRGFQVSGVSSTNLREVAAMRQLLECHGLKESFQRGDLEWEGRVVAAHHKLAAMEKRMAANDLASAETWRHYDWAFHVALISACGSNLLLETYASISDKYLRYQMIAAIFRGPEAADEHRVLLECAYFNDTGPAFPPLVEVRRGSGWDAAREVIETEARVGFLTEADSFHDLVRFGWERWTGATPAESIDIAMTLDAISASSRKGVPVEVGQ